MISISPGSSSGLHGAGFGYVGALTIGDLVWSDVNRDGIRQDSEPATPDVRITVTYLGTDGVVGGGDDAVVFDDVTAPAASPLAGALVVGGAPLPGDPQYTAIGLAAGTYAVDLDATTLPAGYAPLDDRDGGDPTHATVQLVAESVTDADFSIFVNVPPNVSPEVAATVCGGTFVIDPLAGTSDVNGDELAVVPTSILAPAGVTVTLLPSGDLQIVTAPSVRSAYVVTWDVTDGRGGTTTVTLSVDVNCVDATTAVACASAPPTLTWSLVGTSDDLQAPVTITWADSTGTVRTTTGGQPLSGSIRWPSASWTRGGVQVTFTTADGAVAGPTRFDYPCAPLPSTGSSTTLLVRLALFGLAAGLALVVASRRRTASTH